MARLLCRSSNVRTPRKHLAAMQGAFLCLLNDRISNHPEMGRNPAQTRADIDFSACTDEMAAPENRALGRAFQGAEIGSNRTTKKIFSPAILY